ncbi:hypothetical protein FISHEDRAFT_74990 [Fistulina hepatica ATCC 64428]|uniref:Uncharacterized protein n=1 Tax=Fistulina hepatica ATCC 64428 TaxID=1128425 RepID=A0A0D7A8R5_9AGAR|nr:hypothetical protein FISHEDRAFT_74990 [Fistulina hepatica ATCC 64428]
MPLTDQIIGAFDSASSQVSAIFTDSRSIKDVCLIDEDVTQLLSAIIHLGALLIYDGTVANATPPLLVSFLLFLSVLLLPGTEHVWTHFLYTCLTVLVTSNSDIDDGVNARLDDVGQLLDDAYETSFRGPDDVASVLENLGWVVTEATLSI